MPPIEVAPPRPLTRRGVNSLEVAVGRGARRCGERTARPPAARCCPFTRYEHVASPTLTTAENVTFCSAATTSWAGLRPGSAPDRHQGKTAAVTESDER